MALQQGQILQGRYRIVEPLGHGGFGAVYRAWDLTLNGPCAVKENFNTSPAAQAQFHREASILFNLRHPNLPRVFDQFVLPGQGQFLVMDFIQGEDLQSILDRTHAPFSESQAVAWVVQVCDALAYLHGQNPPVIHRDIKPANIRITSQDQAVLVDFGIAKVYDPNSPTTRGARAVTPGYSPTEQYGKGGHTDTRSDLYSLGATLYTLLTAREPVESIDRLMGTPLPAPCLLNPAISPGVEQAILKAMELRPEGRFQAAAELKRSLQLPAAAPPPPVMPAPTLYAPIPQTQPAVPAAQPAPLPPLVFPPPAPMPAPVLPRPRRSFRFRLPSLKPVHLTLGVVVALSALLYLRSLVPLSPITLAVFFGGLLVVALAYQATRRSRAWELERRDVAAMLVGAGLNVLLGYLSTGRFFEVPFYFGLRFWPYLLAPVYFGSAFGPLVGFFTGAAGTLLSVPLLGYGLSLPAVASFGLSGLFAGLSWAFSRRDPPAKTALWISAGIAVLVTLAYTQNPYLPSVYSGGAAAIEVVAGYSVLAGFILALVACLRSGPGSETFQSVSWSLLGVLVGYAGLFSVDHIRLHRALEETVVSYYIPVVGSMLVPTLLGLLLLLRWVPSSWRWPSWRV